MVETVTPAGCGGRVRTAAAAASSRWAPWRRGGRRSAAGLLGEALDRPRPLPRRGRARPAGGAARVRADALPAAQRRTEVPEHWRRELPLPPGPGYGAGLGAGLFTHPMVATLVAAPGRSRSATRRPAACLAFFGARAGSDGGPARPAAARSVGGRGAARAPARGAAAGQHDRAGGARGRHIAVTPALGPGRADGGAPTPPPPLGQRVAAGVLDPAGAPAVVVRAPRRPFVRLGGGPLAPPGRRPARLLRHRRRARGAVGAAARRSPASPAPLTKPALDWPYIAYIRALPTGQSRPELLKNACSTGVTRHSVESSRSAGVNIGRPALRGGLIAWHVARPGGARRSASPACAEGDRSWSPPRAAAWW